MPAYGNQRGVGSKDLIRTRAECNDIYQLAEFNHNVE